jgi:diaminopimelate epimerase
MWFTKMHGIGNDYVYVNGFDQPVDDPAGVARKVSDRHFGIGSDGLILILPSDKADVRMRMFNADGSEGEMCGNGVRCVAKYAYDHGLSKSNPMQVETGRGVLTLALKINAKNKVEQVTVNMGEPILDLPKIPVEVRATPASPGLRQVGPHDYELPIDEARARQASPLRQVYVSMGNPHSVAFVPDVARVELERIGPIVEHHKAYPRRINAHWAQVISRNEVRMRTWERGSGITWACSPAGPTAKPSCTCPAAT